MLLSDAMEPHVHPLLDSDIVTLVLRKVGKKQRLCSCALVCSTWQQAAETATTRIEANIDTADKAGAFTRWLRAHPNQTVISNLEVSAPLSDLWLHQPAYAHYQPQTHTLLLPASKLQGLQDLKLARICWSWEGAALGQSDTAGSSRQAQLQAATALTSLTSLHLSGLAASCNIDSLAALTALEDLKTCTASAVCAGLKDALPELRQLTHLSLSAVAVPVCGCPGCNGVGGQLWTAPFSHLTRLQSLSLARQTLSLSSFDVLPTSLTSLEVVETLYYPEHNISLARTPGMCRLPDLQQLKLYGATLDTSALAWLTTLTELSISASGVFSSTGAPQLQPISVLTNLRGLHLHQLWRRQDDSAADAFFGHGSRPLANIELSAAEAAAITAPPCLSRLALGEGIAPRSCEAMCSMFPAAHSLPQLKVLEMCSMGPLIGRVAAEQVVGCCPNLQSVRVRAGCSNFQRETCEQQLSDSLRALSSINGTLTELIVGCPELTVQQAGWHAIAALTGLQYLQLNCLTTAMEDVLELTACRNLQHLLLHTAEMDRKDGLLAPWNWPAIGQHGLHKGKTDVWCQLPSALLARVVQPGKHACQPATVEAANEVAALSYLVRTVIQAQRKERKDLAGLS